MIIPFLCAFVSFLIVFLLGNWLIKYLGRIDLVVKDMNKEEQQLVPLSGGLAVIVGILVGSMVFIFFRTFFNSGFVSITANPRNLELLFASILTITLITFFGFVDDLFILKSKEKSLGLRQWQKPLLTLFASVPLIVVSAGTEIMWVPFIGGVHFGVLYPLILVPLGVMGASNMVNMLAGLNGLETGLGIIYIGSLGLYAFVNQRYLAAFIALIVFASLIAFYFYNKFPAKILPGDSLTYFLGASLATIAIIGNIEKAALIVSIPFFIEFFLKWRGKFNVDSFGYYKDGKVHCKYNKIYSLTHILMIKGKYTEKQIVYFLFLIEAVFAGLIWVI